MDLISPQAPQDTSAYILEGNQATFMKDVIEASRTLPVVVDFGSPRSPVSKQLSPILDKAVIAAAGRVRLVHVDVDANRALVQQLAQLGLPVQSLPTIAAFWQGQIADLISGGMQEAEARQFVEALVKIAGGTMPAADLLAEARAAQEEGDFATAIELYQAILAEEPERAEAWGGLIRTLLAAGAEEEAAEALAQVPAKIAEHAEVAGARSALALASEGREAAAQTRDFEARLAADPDDHQARYDLATAYNAQGKREEAAAALLDIMKRERKWNEDAARLQLLKFFEAWGLEDPASILARRRLSALLFS